MHNRVFGRKITLQSLDVFCTVARLISVSRAADEIGIAQPAVTAHLRSLEQKLGIRLVARCGRNIALTEGGAHVYRWASEIVTRSLELKNEINGLAVGSEGGASVAASMVVGSYVLGRLVPEFVKRYPGSRISTRISNPRMAAEWVRTGESDFAALILDPDENMDDLVLERLWQEKLLLIASPNSRLVGNVAEPAALAELPFITPPKGLVARDLEDAALSAYGIVRRNVVLEFGHPEPMKSAVLADVGVSFQLETAVQEEVDLGVLRVVPVPGIEIFQTVGLLYRKRKRFSALQRQLMNFIRTAQPRGLHRLGPSAQVA
jgi:DNA-binding transcriptional LysR family regulator